nr:alpha-(1,3)-fucosyltransferase C [Helicoverpa armigera]
MIKKILLVTFTTTLCSLIIVRLIQIAFDTNLKYILVFNDPHRSPIKEMIGDRSLFFKKKCPVNNCYITKIKSVVRRISDFDAIMFYGPKLDKKPLILPKDRSNQQKYIFLSGESAVNYPVRCRNLRGVFNWTMTYKLNSDIYLGYPIIRNITGSIIGPKPIMHWLKWEDMKPIDSAFKKNLEGKIYAAAWFVSNKHAANKRREIALQIQDELSDYNMTLDIFGPGEVSCPRNINLVCLSLLERYYYFYLSFENSLIDDYVTEKLLTPLQHYTVPIVYGGANYTRFMPEGSYLDVRTLGIKMLVEKMVAAIRNKTIYYDFFRWTNHYSYHSVYESPMTDPQCELCRKLNDKNSMKEVTIIENFSAWWRSKACFDSDNYKNGSLEPLNFVKVTCWKY